MTNLDHILIGVNPAFARLLHGKPEEFIGRNLYDFVDAANRAILVEQGLKRARGEQSVYEIGLTRLDGTAVPCQFSATPIIDEAAPAPVPSPWSAIFPDVTLMKLTCGRSSPCSRAPPKG